MKQAFSQVKETIVRVWGNIKWLLNHPTTNFTIGKPFGASCDYCGAQSNLITYNWDNGLQSIVCWNCIFKALDRCLTDLVPGK